MYVYTAWDLRDWLFGFIGWLVVLDMILGCGNLLEFVDCWLSRAFSRPPGTYLCRKANWIFVYRALVLCNIADMPCIYRWKKCNELLLIYYSTLTWSCTFVVGSYVAWCCCCRCWCCSLLVVFVMHQWCERNGWMGCHGWIDCVLARIGALFCVWEYIVVHKGLFDCFVWDLGWHGSFEE